MNDCKKDVFLDSYFEFIADPEGLSDEEISQSLKDEGIDVDNALSRINQVVKAGLEARRLERLKEAGKKRTIIEGLLKSKKKFSSIVHGLLEEKPRACGNQHLEAYYRKKESMSQEDSISLLNDIEDLSLLEKLKKKKKICDEIK